MGCIQDTLSSRARAWPSGCIGLYAECVARAKVSCIQGYGLGVGLGLGFIGLGLG